MVTASKTKSSGVDSRIVAAKALLGVFVEGRSLSESLPELSENLSAQDRALAQEIVYGSTRWWSQLDGLLNQLMQKPLRKRDMPVKMLLVVGVYQLRHMRIPAHAAVNTCVTACQKMNVGWAKGLVNAVLRGYERERETLENQLPDKASVQHAYPSWLAKVLTDAWPEHSQDLLAGGNKKPPMTLRVNEKVMTTAAALAAIQSADIAAHEHSLLPAAIVLESPHQVSELPGFVEGHLSVQDAGAQLAAELLEPQAGERILDACCAPGGKTCHILEKADCTVVALDSDAKRMERVHENLQRLQLRADTHVADASAVDDWWDEEPFDKILLDAPCSATGVIRRHPDIKWLRRESDVVALAQTQSALLQKLWALLKPGGQLVYATCSVLPAENHQIIAAFLDQNPQASAVKLPDTWGFSAGAGRQILPGELEMDGFFYAVLQKKD